MTRDKNINIDDLELAKAGCANGISLQLEEAIKNGKPGLSQTDKYEITVEAARHYGAFLTALGVDWENDPNSSNTPMRVAKAYVNDKFSGRFKALDEVTSFPSDGYTGIIQEFKFCYFVSF